MKYVTIASGNSPSSGVMRQYDQTSRIFTQMRHEAEGIIPNVVMITRGYCHLPLGLI